MSSTKHLVAKLSELGNLTEVKIGDAPLLLAKHQGKVHAVGAKCTHYGAPLKNGVLTQDGRLTCPWHGACFKVTTGDIEDAPALDALASFKVDIEGDHVYVTASEQDVKNGRRAPAGCKSAASSKESVVIVGGGASAITCAEGLRESGYTGKIKMFSQEPNLPLDRTKLSKALIGDPSSIQLRSAEALANTGISVTQAQVTAVDKAAKTITLESGETVPFTKLVLAVGAYPSKLPIQGVDLGNIHILRVASHAKAISSAVGDDKTKHVIILGGSFIGTEVATALIGKAASVTVIEPTYPFQKVLGEKVAKRLVALHEEKGVRFVTGDGSVKAFKPSAKDASLVGSAELDNGTTLLADVVILATGVKPQTEFLKPVFDVQKDGGIDVEPSMLVKGENSIYAVGDIARCLYPGTNTYSRIEHWNVAQNQGRTAAYHIADKDAEDAKVPIFWTSQQGKQVRYCGHATEFDDVIIQGDLEELTFSAFYVKDDTVLAVLTIGTDPVMAQSAELMRQGKMLSASEIRSGRSPLDVKV